jgi:RNA polymerase sigma-70 factor, ECF subfamily
MLAQADAIDTEPDPIAALIGAGRHREAAAECVRRHGAALGRLCMALTGSQADAEEAAQETLLAACAQMPSYRGEGTVRAWLFGIARRQCARRFEQGAREGRRLALVRSAEAGGETPVVSVTAMRRARAVRDAMAELKPSEREALILHYQGGLSFREIGVVCGIDEAAARKRASRGLARLRRTITPDRLEG